MTKQRQRQNQSFIYYPVTDMYFVRELIDKVAADAQAHASIVQIIKENPRCNKDDLFQSSMEILATRGRHADFCGKLLKLIESQTEASQQEEVRKLYDELFKLEALNQEILKMVQILL
jgi:hypothetical protein